ncbi:MAG: carbohydrate kinase family protein [Acidobacteriota bacterium]|nr:MAG: carbohydrate kinase family protein [Acidobacteriota bacterium]
MEKGIACCGHWVVDRTKTIDRFPEENGIAQVLSETIGSGGCAFNTIINLAKFDADLPLQAVGMLGEDPEGDYILQQCSSFPNIDSRHLVRSKQERTACTDVYSVPSKGTRTFFSLLGASRLLGPETIDLDSLDASIFHLGYLSLLEAFDGADDEFGRVSARFLKAVQEKGIKTSLDMISTEDPDFAEFILPALPYTDFLILNDYEAERLTGQSVRSDGSPDLWRLGEVSLRLLDHGIGELVTIHFPEGAYLRTQRGDMVIQCAFAIPKEQIKGTAGAGDSFCAGLLYGLHQGFTLTDCMEFATCAGALSLHDVSTTGAIGNCDLVWQIRKRYPLRQDWFSC